MADRSHLSIGEVLSLLREEFPDVTISKIRFLESQGLVDPERTPSGYRKFYEHDVDRLRWILRQQREHFLPLKVIRGRLTSEPAEMPSNGEPEPEQAPVPEPAVPVPAGRSRPLPSLFADKPHADKPLADKPPGDKPLADRPPPPAARLAGTPAPAEQHGSRSLPKLRTTERSRPAVAPPPPPADPALPAAAPVAARAADPADEADSYTAGELAVAAAAPPSLVTELEQFGLISARAVVAGVPYFDETALAVTRTAAEFSRHGVEVRHLRIWRNAADREADLFQQIVLPLLRQRNPQSRRQASDTLTELARLGGDLRQALIGRAVRDIR